MISAIEVGDRKPGLPLAIRLRDVVGIPIEAWDENAAASPAPTEAPQ